jgi:hypothetical protein
MLSRQIINLCKDDISEFLAAFGPSLREAGVAIADDLAGESPSFVERLLSEQIAVSWLDLHRTILTRRYLTVGASVTLADYFDRAVSRAQRRYLAALRTLASVRRLDLAVIGRNIQVNIRPESPPPTVPAATIVLDSPPDP